MKTVLLGALLLAGVANAQAVTYCVCTSGCTVVSDPYPPGASQPTECTATIGSTKYGPSPVVDSATIPTSNASKCSPAAPAYVPGVTGSVACKVSIPAQSPNTNVSVTLSAANSAGSSGQSVALQFQSVSALPTVPGVPGNPAVR